VWPCIPAFLHQPDALRFSSKEEFVVGLPCVQVLERTLSRAVVVDVVAVAIGRDDIESLFEYIKHGLGYSPSDRACETVGVCFEAVLG
jgi:hypothetical protein